MTKSPVFRNLIRESTQGLVLSPILHAYLYDAKYPEFTLKFAAGKRSRKPDDYFHPSTHPLMSARKLYYYLAEPNKVVVEPLEYMGSLSTTMGTAVHGFIEACLKDTGVLVPAPEICPSCNKHCGEHPAIDERTKARGHMDGVLNVPGWGVGGFEFKTSNMMKLSGVNDNDIETFKKKWPQYYAQVQEYMRITGLRQFIVLFMGMGYPWTLKEFQIPYDLVFAMQIEQKYLSVRQHVAEGVLPEPCCAPFSAEAKACPARAVCPIGAMIK